MSPDDAALEQLVRAGRVTPEQAAWLRAEARRRGAPLAALMAERRLGSSTDAPSLAPPLAAPAPAAVAPDAVRIGRYVVERELGRGAMGVVVRARDPITGREVAIKRVLGAAGAEELLRFQREVTAVARLRHPAIVAVHEANVERGLPYLVMELVDGASLEEHLTRGALERPQRLAILRDVALGLAHAHAQGVIHRDVKPANILVDADLRPRIADFGLARGPDATSLTRTGTVLGTPTTMAPEQAAGEHRDHGPATDVWALGAILYRALTGAHPFAQGSIEAQLKAILLATPTPPSRLAPGLDPRLDDLVLRCLQKSPADRPTALDVARELEQVLAGPAARPRASRSLLAAGAALGGGAITLALVVLLRSPPLPPPPPPPAPAPAPSAPSAPGVARQRLGEQGRTIEGGGPFALVARTGSLVWREGDAIGDLAASKDGRVVVSVGHGTFRRWNTRTGVSTDLDCDPDPVPPQTALSDGQTAHELWSDAAACTADGKLAVRGDRGGRLLLHVEGERAPRLVARVPGWIRSVAFDGEERLVAGGDQGELWSIGVADGAVSVFGPRLSGHVRVAVLDGDVLVAAAGQLIRIERPSGKVVAILDSLEGEATRIDVLRRRYVVSIAGSPTVALVGWKDAPPSRIYGDGLHGYAAAFVGKDAVAIVGNGVVLACDLENQTRWTEALHDQAHGVCALREGFLTGDYSGRLRAWTCDGEPLDPVSGREGRVSDLSVTPDGRRVVIGAGDATAHVWTLATGEERAIDLEGRPAQRAHALDDRRAVVWSNGALCTVGLDGGPLRPGPATPAGVGPEQGLRVVGPGRVITAHREGAVLAWDLERGTVERLATTPGISDLDVAGQGDDLLLLLGGPEGTDALLRPGQAPTPLGVRPGWTTQVAFARDGRLLASGCDRVVRTWTPDRAPGPTLAHERTVRAVVALPDGRAVSASDDGTVRLWSPAGAELARLDLRPVDRPVKLAVTPEPARVLVGTQRGQVLALEVR